MEFEAIGSAKRALPVEEKLMSWTCRCYRRNSGLRVVRSNFSGGRRMAFAGGGLSASSAGGGTSVRSWPETMYGPAFFEETAHSVPRYLSKRRLRLYGMAPCNIAS